MTERSKRILDNYPHIHLFGNLYLVRNYTYQARRFSLWTPYLSKPCLECKYYFSENGVCQSKKVATMGYGYVGLSEYLFCSPCKDESENGGEQG